MVLTLYNLVLVIFSLKWPQVGLMQYNGNGVFPMTAIHNYNVPLLV